MLPERAPERILFELSAFAERVVQGRDHSPEFCSELYIGEAPAGGKYNARIERFLEDSRFNSSMLVDWCHAAIREHCAPSNLTVLKEKIVLKEPGSPAFGHHRDFDYGWWRYGRNFVTILIMIDDADKDEVGPLVVLPGSHKLEIDSPYQPLDPKRPELLEREERTLRLTRGSVVLIDGKLVHYSNVNRSSRPRRALYVSFCTDRSIDNSNLRDMYYSFIPNLRHRFVAELILRSTNAGE